MEVKYCTKCNLAWPLSNFHKRKAKKDGHSSWCKNCVSLWSKLYAAKNKEKRKRQHQAWILKNTFGLTPEDYSDLLQKQKGVCYICKNPETKITKGVLCRLAVDHNHKTGQVRGLLCDRCNRGLGYFKDSPALLRTAADYLEREED